MWGIDLDNLTGIGKAAVPKTGTLGAALTDDAAAATAATDSTAAAASLVHGVYTTTTDPVKLLDSANYGVDTYVYLKTLATTTSTANQIYIGITEGTQNDMGTESGTDDRTMILKAGDFAFFPWSGDQDIHCEGDSGTQNLEYWVFKQS